MEIFRNFPPKDNFLQKVRDLSTKKKNSFKFFDECTTGFRETYSDYKKYKANQIYVFLEKL